MSAATSPPARRLERPRWLDPRLVVGMLLVLASIAVGARVVAAAEQGDLVWSAARDLPAGTTLQIDDLTATSVRLSGSTSQYVDASIAPPAGYLLVRDVTAGELVPAAAMTSTEQVSTRRLVSVPVAPNHFPSGLTRGHRVDVYVTATALPGALAPTGADETAGEDTTSGEPDRVLANAAVSEVTGGSDGFAPSSGSVGVVLEVAADDAPALVAAVAAGTIQLVRVPDSP